MSGRSTSRLNREWRSAFHRLSGRKGRQGGTRSRDLAETRVGDRTERQRELNTVQAKPQAHRANATASSRHTFPASCPESGPVNFHSEPYGTVRFLVYAVCCRSAVIVRLGLTRDVSRGLEDPKLQVVRNRARSLALTISEDCHG